MSTNEGQMKKTNKEILEIYGRISAGIKEVFRREDPERVVGCLVAMAPDPIEYPGFKIGVLKNVNDDYVGYLVAQLANVEMNKLSPAMSGVIEGIKQVLKELEEQEEKNVN